MPPSIQKIGENSSRTYKEDNSPGESEDSVTSVPSEPRQSPKSELSNGAESVSTGFVRIRPSQHISGHPNPRGGALVSDSASPESESSPQKRQGISKSANSNSHSTTTHSNSKKAVRELPLVNNNSNKDFPSETTSIVETIRGLSPEHDSCRKITFSTAPISVYKTYGEE